MRFQIHLRSRDGTHTLILGRQVFEVLVISNLAVNTYIRIRSCILDLSIVDLDLDTDLTRISAIGILDTVLIPPWEVITTDIIAQTK